ncbi:MAG: cytochrome b/b6 domain-containing protein [Mangrovicoccus sp.]|nr:cytochrome b/b6 domain-containing protein [Mangrovicoccus sp.]
MASLGNTQASYGAIAKTLHWLTALLILTLFPLGMIANQLPYETSAELARKAWLFSLHKTLGVSVFFVALARILWALSQPKPALLNAEKKLESFAAELVHWLLYVSLVIVPLSGWIHHAATTGFAPIWWPFGQDLPLVPKSEAVAGFFGAWHFVFTKVMALSLALHIAGALKHHFVDRDATLRRMLPGDLALDVPAHPHPRAPIVAALVLYGAAIGGASVLGLSHSHGAAAHPEVAALEAKASGWNVQEGSLGITATQFGSDLAGEFGQWQAAIEYDPEADGPVKGRVEVDIAIGSLTLGGVTSDALKPEFLDAEGHPVARFEADLQEGAEGLEAAGTLTIKGVEMPALLPFTLEIDGDLARAQGGLVIDRRDFQVGTTSYNDEATVGFAVSVTVDLLAQRAQ